MGNEDNAWIPMALGPNHHVQSINRNMISSLFTIHVTYKTSLKLTELLVDLLRDDNDPRLMIISSGIGPYGSQDKVVNPALQKGQPSGHDYNSLRQELGVPGEEIDLDTIYSRMNELMLDLDDLYLLQTYAEVELLLAEAVVKGWYSGDAETHYNNGVRAAMQMYDIFDGSLVVSDTEVDNYLSAHPFDPSNGLEMIGTQYWLATYMNFYEAYANWRRTGFPVLTPVNYPGNDTNGTIPRRFIFPIDEVVKNEVNYRAALDRMGPDEMTTRVWWDRVN